MKKKLSKRKYKSLKNNLKEETDLENKFTTAFEYIEKNSEQILQLGASNKEAKNMSQSS